MAENNELRNAILAKLDEWTKLEPEVREDAFIEVDLLDGSVKFLDADDLIKRDLEGNREEQLTYFVINPWDFAEYDEDTQKFTFIENEVNEAITEAQNLCAEFSEK